jgi:glucose-6-phosphate isomerase
MSRLSLDLTGMMEAGVGHAGIHEAELAQLATSAADAVEQTLALRRAGTIGFLDLPDDTATARSCMDYARELSPEVDTMVVLGIGGSSLGPQSLYAALTPAYDIARPRSPGMPRRLLFPDNSDPETFRALLDTVDPARTVWNVVTKSGSTAETAAQLMVVADRFARDRIVVTTDPEAGALRALANDLDLRAFAIPANVGGRFSVFTPVGLLPAAVAGLDVMGLCDGARAMRDRVLTTEVRANPALMLASLLHLHAGARKRPMVVMMPYADALYSLGDWFRQLWGESLGKSGRGSTPIVSRGATDQHSQLQLYADGPDDKVYVFVAPAERGADIEIPGGELAGIDAYGYLAGRRMGELIDAELRGTIASLRSRGRPHCTITLPRVDAPSVGAFAMLWQAATAFAGPLFGVPPFDQPGVEQAKRLTYAALGRDGYEDEARSLKDAPPPDPRYQL